MGKIRDYILWTLKGIGIGAANVIPGVSGGTIAFLTGIFERLINSLKSFNFRTTKLLFQGKFKQWAKETDIVFLLFIILGIAISAFSLAKLMLYLLHNHPVATWAFFFGLVLVSCWYVTKEIKVWNIGTFISLALGIAIAVWVSLTSPTETPDTWWFILIAGAASICGMILPGISGSFLLVLMVKYEDLMQSISSLNLPRLALYLVGAVAGLLAFSHFLAWLLKHWYNQTIALLTGFMVGSLVKIWPWQQILMGEGDKAVTHPILPAKYAELYGQDPKILTAIIMAIVGIAIVVILETWANKEKKTQPE
ncbi:MAG: DUF368 domain-containing protein [Bacteroidales bacterium]|nr:DUF368 domain-containing protein [Bacteroidales bacterium]